MSRRPRAKPKTPEEIMAARLAERRQDLEAVGVPLDAATLPHGEAVEVIRAGAKHGEQTAKHDTARRLDAFEALRGTMAPGCYDAARRLEQDILIRYGWSDRPTAGERVDCTAGPITDAKLAAGRRVDQINQRLSCRDTWLLTELIVGHADRPLWRQIVAHITGEENPNAQGAAVRAATVNLRDVYEAMETKVAA